MPGCECKRLPDGRFEVTTDGVTVGYAVDQMQAAEMIERELGEKRKEET